MQAATFLLFLAMGITLIVLIAGLIVMIRGGAVSEKYSNKLMQARVVAQGVAILMLAIVMLMGK